MWPVWPTVSRALSPPALQVQINKQFGTISRSPSTPPLLKMLQTWEKATDGIGSTIRTIPPHYKEVFDVIYQKRVRRFHQGFQTPRNRWKHETVCWVLLLFCGVWNPWWNPKNQFLRWLLKRNKKYAVIHFFAIVLPKWKNNNLCSNAILPYYVTWLQHTWLFWCS